MLHGRLIAIVHRLGRKHAGGEESPSSGLTKLRERDWRRQYDTTGAAGSVLSMMFYPQVLKRCNHKVPSFMH
jgi:hypothetical protein